MATHIVHYYYGGSTAAYNHRLVPVKKDGYAREIYLIYITLQSIDNNELSDTFA